MNGVSIPSLSYERKTRSDHGKKRPRDSNASSSSTTLNHPSSSHPLDDIVDVNDEESFRSNSSSPFQNVSFSSNVVSRVVQNPPNESQHLNTYLSETIDFQTQHRDDHRKGLGLIGKTLKDMMSGRRKTKNGTDIKEMDKNKDKTGQNRARDRKRARENEFNDFCCSEGDLEDKILVPKPPQNCATCGDPVDGITPRVLDIGSPGVDGPPIMPEDPYAYIMAAYQVPPSPDYIPGPEVPPSPDYIPPPLDFIYQDMFLSLIRKKDDEDPEEDPPDYPADRDDDDDDDEDEDGDEEEEDEHPAPADSVPPVHHMTARISIRDEPSISLPPREVVEILLALTTPPPSPLTLLSSPLPHIPSPPFPASLPASPIRPLGYRAAMIRTDRPKITLPPRKRLGIDLGLRYEIGESSAVAATRPVGGRRADYGFVVTMDTEIRQQRAEEVGYGIRDVWIDPREAVEEEALVSQEAWGRSIEVSYMTRSEIMALRSVVVGQQAVISQLQAADRKN
ncbi:hypothetical protein Tco_0612829 [Tanacetum coccineum]